MIQRSPIKFREKVPVPEELKKFLWDHPDGNAPLEKLLLRTFEYGSFEQIKSIYRMYPEESYDLVSRYNNIKRGVKYWIHEWH